MIVEIVNFRNPKNVSPIAPEYKWSIISGFLSNINFKNLCNIILEKEKEILSIDLPDYLIKDGYTGLGNKSLTSRFLIYNLLEWDYPEIYSLRKEIKNFYEIACESYNLDPSKPVYIKCWANVLRKGQKMDTHRHSVDEHCFLSGHLTVKCDDTKTVYINPSSDVLIDQEYYYLNNAVGRISIFNSNIYHYTTEHQSDNERITIAFDIFYNSDLRELFKIIEL